MLVLTRRKDEVIKIGKDIKITVVELQGAKVRLGIDAPQTTVIMREELIDNKTNLRAASAQNNQSRF